MRDTMNTGFRIGRIAGIELHIDWSLLIIFLIIAFSLAAGLLPGWHPDWTHALAWAVGFTAAALFFCSVLLHELSHALVGRMHGIEVRRITLFVFGGAAQIEQEPPNWHGELQTAIVGPVVSLVLGGICIAATGLLSDAFPFDADNLQESLAHLSVPATLLLWLGQVNIALGLFNLVPAFPLDGGRVLRALMWAVTGDLRRSTRWASSLGQGFAWVLIGIGVAMILGVQVPVFGTGLAGGLWLCLIGWFLNNAAMVSYWQLVVRDAFRDMPVSRLMDTRFDTVAPDLPVSRLVEDFLLHGDQHHFPVVIDGRPIGMVSLQQVRALNRDEWRTTSVSALMTPIHPSQQLSPSSTVQQAMSLLGESPAGTLAVIESGRVRGLVRREDVGKWLSLYEDVDAQAAALPGRAR